MGACESCNIFLESTWFCVPFSSFIILNSDQCMCLYVIFLAVLFLFFSRFELLCMACGAAVVNLLGFVLLGKWQKMSFFVFYWIFFRRWYNFSLHYTNSWACNGQSIFFRCPNTICWIRLFFYEYIHVDHLSLSKHIFFIVCVCVYKCI